MIRIDSTKILIPSTAITDIDYSKLQLIQVTEPGTGNIKSEKYFTTDNLGIGFKRVSFDKNRNESIIEVSGKVLKDDYFELINKNTVEWMFVEVNKYSPIKYDNVRVMDESKVLSMDCTNNLKVSQEPVNYISALNQVRINQKYNVTDYREPGNKGIVIAGKQKTYKERMIFYDKIREINRDKALQTEPYFVNLQGQHTNVLRIESNFTSFAKIKEYTGTAIFLRDILNSNENPNLKLFDKITKPSRGVQLYLELGKFAGMTLYEIEKRIGMEGIIKLCNYDINLIIQFIKERREKRTNNSKVIKNYRMLLAEVLPGTRLAVCNELIEEVRQLLLVA